MMSELLAQLRREIEALAAGKCLLWVDPAQRDPYEDNDMVAQRRIRVPINHVRFAMHRAPYLVPLDLAVADDAALFDDSVSRAFQAWTIDSLRALHGQPICGWVITTFPAEAVAVHWGRHCHLHGHQYKTKLLRFHDPGVREWLWPTLSTTQKSAMLGPATRVFAVGRDQRLVSHAGDDSGTAPASFQLNDLQWQQLSDYATVHAAWLACAVPASASHPPLSAPELLATLTALDQATRHGITQRTERQLFAQHAMQLGHHFHADHRMQAIWPQTRTGNYYGSVIEDVFTCAADELHLHWTST